MSSTIDQSEPTRHHDVPETPETPETPPTGTITDTPATTREPEKTKDAAIASIPDTALDPDAQSGVLPATVNTQQGIDWDAISASTPSIDDASEDDRDSAIDGMSLWSSTVSVRSSIYEHVKENGRTYHRYKQGKYPLPNDELEQDRLDLQHALFLVTLHNHLYLAPIDNPQNVLDVATGTGIWAIEFAHEHPQANVLGTDLSAIQPVYVPSNCRFEIDDAEDEWVFRQKFDYIHGRALLTCFTSPSNVIRQAHNSLAPGGWLELQDGIFPMEYIGETPVDSDLFRWNKLIVEASIKSGRPWTNVPHYKRWMQEIGFQDVEEKSFYWPTSAWPKGKYLKTVAMYWQEDLLSGLEGISMKLFTGQLGWSPEEVQVFLVGVRKDLKDKAIHAYLPIRVIYGRKSMTGEMSVSEA